MGILATSYYVLVATFHKASQKNLWATHYPDKIVHLSLEDLMEKPSKFNGQATFQVGIM